jgi:hypothetical protein
MPFIGDLCNIKSQLLVINRDDSFRLVVLCVKTNYDLIHFN